MCQRYGADAFFEMYEGMSNQRKGYAEILRGNNLSNTCRCSIQRCMQGKHRYSGRAVDLGLFRRRSD